MSQEFPSTHEQPSMQRVYTYMLDLFREEPDRAFMDELGIRINVTGIEEEDSKIMLEGRRLDHVDLKNTLEAQLQEDFGDFCTVTLGSNAMKETFILIEEKVTS